MLAPLPLRVPTREKIAENSPATIITEAFAAVDPADGEDDDSDTTTDGPAVDDDLLTYELLDELDADSFTITGTIDHNSVVTPAISNVPDGQLTFNGGADYESKTKYRVKVRATDPTGRSDTATVTINITPIDEEPVWVMASDEEVYPENGTDDVFMYEAEDPEESGITYSLVDTITVDGSRIVVGEGPLVNADIADVDLFEIDENNGVLEFKASPNYEDPKDNDDDNRYQVTVKAESEDAIYQKVTVIVTNLNEAPVFSETTDALEITENPDDPGERTALSRRVSVPAEPRRRYTIASQPPGSAKPGRWASGDCRGRRQQRG